jgi:hypothetical protein
MIKNYFNWFQRPWPLHVIPGVVIIYFIFLSFLHGKEAIFNNWYGAALQIVGGLQLIWALDDNLRGLKGQTILEAIKKNTIEWFRSFPLWAKTNVSLITGTANITFGAVRARLQAKHNYTDLTQRIEYLEKQTEQLYNELDNHVDEFHSKLTEQRKALETKIEASNRVSSELKTLITDLAVGDIKGEISGLCLVIIGTVISAIQ